MKLDFILICLCKEQQVIKYQKKKGAYRANTQEKCNYFLTTSEN